MIAHKDYKDKQNSKYICDRCRTELTGEERVIIYVDCKKSTKGFRKKWDFCTKCYRLLVRGVEKRAITEGGTNDNT